MGHPAPSWWHSVAPSPILTVMPPGQFSRYLFCDLIDEVRSSDGETQHWLTDRIPFRFRPFLDTVVTRAMDDDTFDRMAGRFYRVIPRACGLWWVIADFQPEPVHDPTLVLAPGTLVHVPSIRVVREHILNPRRRLDAEA